jgi:hypothetical protein
MSWKKITYFKNSKIEQEQNKNYFIVFQKIKSKRLKKKKKCTRKNNHFL